MSDTLLRPLFKYPGGKRTEYKYLKDFFPQFDTYIEPFLGGGAVYWATEAQEWVINDSSQELISIYRYVQEQDELFLCCFGDIARMWDVKDFYTSIVVSFLSSVDECNEEKCVRISKDLLDTCTVLPKNYGKLAVYLRDSVLRKHKTLLKLSKKGTVDNWEENALGVLGSAVYTYLRFLYNTISFEQSPQLKTALYFFIREYAYSSMFRYNSDGFFNVPFGGNSYAKKSFFQRLDQITSVKVVEKLKKTTILCGDFSDAFIDQKNTFMFLDPPYDTEFSTYNLRTFGEREQIRLRDELLRINQTKWMLVIKSTDFIETLYGLEGLHRIYFDKSYSVNFKNRNERTAKHVVVTNYRLENI